MRFLIAALALLPLLACTPKAKGRLLQDDFRYEQAYFPEIQMLSLDIVDEREEREFELTSEQRHLIREEVRKHLGGGGKKYAFKVIVKAGEKSLQSKMLKKREQVRAGVRVELSNGSRTVGAGGEAELEITSNTASDEYREKLFQKALRDSIHQSFESLKSASGL